MLLLNTLTEVFSHTYVNVISKQHTGYTIETMNNESVIENNLALNNLLINKDIKVSYDFSKDNFSAEFKEYIKNMFYESFNMIYDKNIVTQNHTKIITVLESSKYLATEEIIKKILNKIEYRLEQSYNNLESVKNVLKFPEVGYEYKVQRINNSLDYLTEYILNNFDSFENIHNYQEKIIDSSLDICEIVSKNNPKKNNFLYATNEVLIKRLQKFNKSKIQNERYTAQLKLIDKKREQINIGYKISIIMFVIAIIIILLRIGKFAKV